jgi:hypothetical protein
MLSASICHPTAGSSSHTSTSCSHLFLLMISMQLGNPNPLKPFLQQSSTRKDEDFHPHIELL